MELHELRKERLSGFKREMQEAFQQGYENQFGKADDSVLPEEDMDESLNAPNAIAYEVVENGERLGGAIIALSDDGQQGDLHFLYTKVGHQNRGVASFAWKAIENRHPGVNVWETHTPYFETRNIHFYVNRCGFHIVEFFCSHHPDPNDFATRPVNPMGGNGFFRFEKRCAHTPPTALHQCHP